MLEGANKVACLGKWINCDEETHQKGGNNPPVRRDEQHGCAGASVMTVGSAAAIRHALNRAGTALADAR